MFNFFHIFSQILRHYFFRKIQIVLVSIGEVLLFLRLLFLLAAVILNFKEIYMAINALFVHLSDLLSPHFIDWLENLLFVKVQAFFLNNGINLWIIWEYLFMDEFFGESEPFDILIDSHIDKLTL